MHNIENIIKSINKIKHKIPEQGPLEYFVHHNTIHHYENHDFFHAVTIASQDFQSNAFMPDEYYQEQYDKQKISKENINYEIDLFKSKYNIKLPSHIIFRLLIQKKTDNLYADNEKIKEIRELYTDQKNTFYSSVARDGYGVEIDYIISSHILKFFSVYFDFGSAFWLMPNRELGMWQSFVNLYKKSYLFSGKYLKYLAKSIYELNKLNSITSILTLLEKLKITDQIIDEYLFEIASRYKGWLGFIKSLEQHPEWVKNKHIKPSFIDALAIIMLCEYTALKIIGIPISKISAVPRIATTYKHSYDFINYLLYEQTKHLDLSQEFTEATKYLTDINRKKILHKAFEKTFYNNFLNTYALQQKTTIDTNTNPNYDYQVICCIDEREESFRRYLELDNKCQTFGTAGHFSLPIQFKSFFDKHTRALCPVVVKPKYKIIEKGYIKNKSFIKSLFIWGEIQWLDALNSKTMLRGMAQSFIGFFTKAIPFILDIISPALTYKTKHYFTNHINKSVSTVLRYKKNIINTGLCLEDRTKIALDFLNSIGINNNFSDYIFVIGHGSSSLNNPHEAAYDCGACGGGRGGANARLMSLILNESIVRENLLNQYNINIPKNTLFIGAYHNTCNDNITFYDQDKIYNKNLNNIKQKIYSAANLNSMERCRRFSSVVFNKSPNYYHKKVQQRAIDLRQPRPEYGHSTNALCIIGPRSYTRNLFLDRRAFLVSYDESTDNNGNILFNTLNTAVPVCAGINLEYFFSYIDNDIYGCGTKLPHNVTSLIGVMNGYQSDLQLGLSWQMVEIHEPIRLCILVICNLALIKKLLNQNSNFKQLIENRWVEFVIHNTTNNKIYNYINNTFIEYKPNEYPKSYFRVDMDIMNTSENLDFGYIV